MKTIIPAITLIFMGLGYSQTVVTKLNDFNVHVHRGGQNTGHNAGFEHTRDYIAAQANDYGYTFTTTDDGNVDVLNSVFNSDNLWSFNGDGSVKRGAVDIIILSQGEGDRTVGGGPSNTQSAEGADARFAALNEHVRAGGGLIHVHASCGRAVTQQGWVFGGKLAGDWFHDGYTTPGSNAGHFSWGTQATVQIDAEASDEQANPSIYLIRKLMTTPVNQGGLGLSAVEEGIAGEWYHFNGGARNPDGTGGDVYINANNYQARAIRRVDTETDQGIPEEGIGPSLIYLSASRMGNFTAPHENGRHLAWGREVSNGTFDPDAHATNGRYVQFNPGHTGPSWTQNDEYFGKLFMATLRWMAKDDLGCTNDAATNYSAMATIDDGTCAIPGCTDPQREGYDPEATVDDGSCGAIGVGGLPGEKAQFIIGSISVYQSGVIVPVQSSDKHSINVLDVKGSSVYQNSGRDKAEYNFNLSSGTYIALVKSGQRTLEKSFTVK